MIFAADALKKEQTTIPTDTEVLSSVLLWKDKRKPPLDVPLVASTIRNLGLLHWLDVKPDASLPMADEEFISA